MKRFICVYPPSLKLRRTSLWFLSVFICGLSFAAGHEDLTSVFYSANKLYEQGKYEEAAGEYKNIIDMGFESGPLYYNLGNCYFKLGSLGKTILYYERAMRLIPEDPELKFNYKYIQTLLQDKIEPYRMNWFIDKVKDIAEFLVLGKWLGFIVVMWIILMGILTINIFIKRNIFRHMCAGIIVIFILVIIFASIQYRLHSAPVAVILPKEVPVRYAPGEAEVEAFILHEGAKVIVKKKEENWYQIQLPDGKSGWIFKDSIEWI